MMKPCKDCRKPTKYKLRRVTLCLPCKAARQRDYCKRTDYHKRRYKRLSKQERERHLIKKYGVTLAVYDAMFTAQNGCCAICGKTQSKAFDVDHCHATGEVRGLLCTNCNRMLGHAHDSHDRLLNAAIYLSSRKSPPNSSKPV